MPVHYNISPELDMILFVCKGLIKGPEIFGVADLLRDDPRFHYGMLVVVDLFAAADEFELEDILVGIGRMNETTKKGYKCANIVLLSVSTGMNLLVDALQLSSEVPLNITVCPSLDQAIDRLGMSRSRADIVKFWEENREA